MSTKLGIINFTKYKFYFFLTAATILKNIRPINQEAHLFNISKTTLYNSEIF